jgi:hypothetical protein
MGSLSPKEEEGHEWTQRAFGASYQPSAFSHQLFVSVLRSLGPQASRVIGPKFRKHFLGTPFYRAFRRSLHDYVGMRNFTEGL